MAFSFEMPELFTQLPEVRYHIDVTGGGGFTLSWFSMSRHREKIASFGYDEYEVRPKRKSWLS